MTPADRRITELIDKWLTSIELHLQYTELSDAAYARVQPWQRHDRPTRWVLEVARQKVLELKQLGLQRLDRAPVAVRPIQARAGEQRDLPPSIRACIR